MQCKFDRKGLDSGVFWASVITWQVCQAPGAAPFWSKKWIPGYFSIPDNLMVRLVVLAERLFSKALYVTSFYMKRKTYFLLSKEKVCVKFGKVVICLQYCCLCLFIAPFFFFLFVGELNFVSSDFCHSITPWLYHHNLICMGCMSCLMPPRVHYLDHDKIVGGGWIEFADIQLEFVTVIC